MLTCCVLLLAVNTAASEVTDKLKKRHIAEYTEMKKVCNRWAAEEAVNKDEKASYVEQCIEDEIGYLLDEETDVKIEVEERNSSPESR